MTTRNFDEALSLVLKHEGGYVDHPKDPGGATNMGITIGTLRAYRGKAVTKAQVKALTREEAAAIYRKNYWDAVKGDKLPSGVDYAVFDFAVNSGVGRAIPFLQRALGVPDDGVIGTATLKAVAATDPVKVLNAICDARLAWLKRLGTWGTFGKGWSNRIAGVRRAATAMVMASTPPDIPAPDITPKPQNADLAVGTGAVVAVAAAATFWDHIWNFISNLF